MRCVHHGEKLVKLNREKDVDFHMDNKKLYTIFNKKLEIT